MKVEKLVAMANQIARFFHAYPDPAATASVRHHLVAFWTPAMVQAIAHRVAQDATGIDPLVVRAMQNQTGADTLIDRATSPVGKIGALASDAG